MFCFALVGHPSVIHITLKISRLVFQIRAKSKSNTHCASYIVDEPTADRTDKLENGSLSSVFTVNERG